MSILSDIKGTKIEEVKSLRKRYSLSSFNSMKHFEKRTISFKDKVKYADGISVIAEIKKASPSKGIIKSNFDHQKIAEVYINADVEAVSVLTDKKYFQGDITFISDISEFSPVPLLRKDFIIDEYQIFESKAHGADMILLICELLSENQLNDLYCAATELNMEVLIELHSETELSKAGQLKGKIIGVNNRDLNDFSVSLDTTLKLSPLLKDASVIVSESGIKTQSDIEKVKQAGCAAVLVGEHLMLAEDIAGEIKKLKEWCYAES